MRWIEVALFFAVLLMTCADPEPKKYKPEVKTKDKDKQLNTTLSDEEKIFLRDIETKFGLKSEVSIETVHKNKKEDNKSVDPTKIKLPFPAVIAIEIVNDTDVKNGKNKRTIDANLGYGYRTNTGYSYSYFGKPAQEKGKFMIYPYSQEDIPPARLNVHTSAYSHNTHPNTGHTKTEVEISPSQAFELVPSQEETVSYNYDKPAIKYEEEPQSVVSPPPGYPTSDSSVQYTPTTLYTTYNGQQFSSLSGQFPSVMSNYFVDPSQLLKNPQYQSAGLTQDHLRSNHLDQRVVPVLVLRVPSSYLKNPSAELYPNLPQNYPYSQHLNHVNLQNLVNQYFKKLGYKYAPQVMSYPSSPLASSENTVSSHVSGHEPQHYASPYVQPSYTQSDYSGVQYSAVQPVMAKFPTGYSPQQYYPTRGQSHYQRQPAHQPQFVYRYRYMPQTSAQSHYRYASPAIPQYHQSYQAGSQEDQQEQTVLEQSAEVHDGSGSAYGEHSSIASDNSQESLSNAEVPQSATTGYEQAHSATPNYEHVEASSAQYEAPQEGAADHSSQISSPYHGSSVQVQYDSSEQQEPINVYHRGQTGHRYSSHVISNNANSYSHQNQATENPDDQGLVLTENYPSKDHTIATVLPLSYNNRNPQSGAVQSVSYVTPVPHTMKYHSQFRVMVPQTVFRSPSSEKVSYVNSHSSSGSYNSASHNPEAEYTASPQYIPPIGRQKPPQYPRNYHSHSKRMTRPESQKSEAALALKKVNEHSNKNKSS